jgi:hypothetical protein
VTLAAQGALYFLPDAQRTAGNIGASLVLLLSGGFLAAGFLTPLAASAAGLFGFASLVHWLPLPVGNLFEGKLGGTEIVIVAIAIALLGPGALSVDARLFGRREIVISPPSRTPKH